MTDQELIAAIADGAVFALTIYGEARSQGQEGMAAVADVVRNRLLSGRSHYGKGYRGVCLRPQQFSCWNADDPNRPLLLDAARTLFRRETGPRLSACVAVALETMGGGRPDSVLGSTHYITEALWKNPELLKKNAPWAVGRRPACQIRDHVFFSHVDG